EQAYAELEQEARAMLDGQGVVLADQELSRWADMRYERQLHDVHVVAPHREGQPITEALAEAFRARYAELYGVGALLAGARPELLRIGVEAHGHIAKPPLPRQEGGHSDATAARIGTRLVFWPELGQWQNTPTYEGPQLRAGHRFDGPAIIYQPGTTIAVPPGASVRIDEYANVVILLQEDYR